MMNEEELLDLLSQWLDQIAMEHQVEPSQELEMILYEYSMFLCQSFRKRGKMAPRLDQDRPHSDLRLAQIWELSNKLKHVERENKKLVYAVKALKRKLTEAQSDYETLVDSYDEQNVLLAELQEKFIANELADKKPPSNRSEPIGQLWKETEKTIEKILGSIEELEKVDCPTRAMAIVKENIQEMRWSVLNDLAEIQNFVQHEYNKLGKKMKKLVRVSKAFELATERLNAIVCERKARSDALVPEAEERVPVCSTSSNLEVH